jgi:rhodanese-related sulfurtransferase
LPNPELSFETLDPGAQIDLLLKGYALSIPHISPAAAKQLIEKGAILVDIRNPGEHASERIQGGRNFPLGALRDNCIGESYAVIVFFCKSGARTRMNAALLSKATQVDAFILDGGIDAWKAAGLPINLEARQPMEMAQQAQITAGALALLGAVLGYVVHAGFYALPGLISGCLIFSGLPCTRGIARVLRLMPWNRALNA